MIRGNLMGKIVPLLPTLLAHSRAPTPGRARPRC